jgi:hypothetical protein
VPVTDWKNPTAVKACLDADLRAALVRLARRADRSLAAELRRAVRAHVERNSGSADQTMEQERS